MSVAIPYADSDLSWAYVDNGVSDESKKLKSLWVEALRRVKETTTNEKRLMEALTDLEEIFKECGMSNWDGYQAKPLTEAAYKDVLKFLEMIPLNLPMPEIVPEPNGTIGLEWSIGKRLIFAISLSGKGTIHYAALFGADKNYGTVEFLDSLPSVVLENIRRLYS